uniref:Uncharacterized protein n=1 Tax=Tuber melanosporum TaxID=39416 RepID=Q8J043_TUBME|nr:hypothetical protein [Tuber melanosporum]CAD30997.1 hypothetical protein [Tuber melanosporum]CAD30998.1 hypothetical protein [Tuber melanosporum]CAD30999.1 hypothetical protein [Tuber melanosporum]CAD31000.1 hypothetical protein [Tuber melanosporum]
MSIPIAFFGIQQVRVSLDWILLQQILHQPHRASAAS